MGGAKIAFPMPLIGDVDEKQLRWYQVLDASMVHAGICLGDWVVVLREAAYNVGDWVVIMLDGDAAVRTVTADAFVPANTLFQAVPRVDGPRALGRVVGVFRPKAAAPAPTG